MIRCLYIEDSNSNSSLDLIDWLQLNGYAFYEAKLPTDEGGKPFHDLAELEALLENK
jgi:hypothetical protein